MIDGLYERDLGLRLVRNANGGREIVRYAAGDDKIKELKAGEDLKTPGLPLELTGERALKAGMAVEASSLEAVYAAIGVDKDRVRIAGGDFFEALATFLRSPGVMVLLVIFGIGGLILELKMPGTTVPGIVSALCFILFFWAFWNSGIVWLAVLLFLLGLALLGIEIFITPGFGVMGVSGILAIVAGLALATVEQMPQTSSQWTQLGNTVTILVGSMVGGVIFAMFMARLLPHVPVANRLILQPPGNLASDLDAEIGAEPGLASLLGATGETTTVLRPAGLARFGERLVDVVSDGGFIAAGTGRGSGRD